MPSNFKSWVKADIASKEDKWAEFPVRLVKIFHFVNSSKWDQWFINFLIIWLLIVIFVSDGWAAKYFPILQDVGQGIALLPIFAMLVTQLVPFLGTIYFLNYCYDLVHYAASISFGKWVGVFKKILLCFITFKLAMLLLVGFYFFFDGTICRILLLWWKRRFGGCRKVWIRSRGPPRQ